MAEQLRNQSLAKDQIRRHGVSNQPKPLSTACWTQRIKCHFQMDAIYLSIYIYLFFYFIIFLSIFFYKEMPLFGSSLYLPNGVLSCYQIKKYINILHNSLCLSVIFSKLLCYLLKIDSYHHSRFQNSLVPSFDVAKFRVASWSWKHILCRCSSWSVI